ncbi:MAG: O-antigen ligase family protein [Phycisphaerae bacterium]|nr:O-antigen ligase family protein [Phycisphaerae bacterium]
MTRGGAVHITQKDSKAFERFEALLLIVCLCVLAVRATYIESPHGGLLNPAQFLTNEAFSVLLSGVLILAAAAWFVAGFCRRTVVYRFSGIEWGLALFLPAAVVAVAAASNKRAAINDMATLIAPMAAAVMLVQILGSQHRLKLVLFVIFALGAVTTWQCADQFFTSNAEMIADYESDPQKHLEVIGAEPGSFEQMLYEHRLYGKDIRGFLTTSNSTGSLLLLVAFAATGLAADCIRARRGRSSDALTACVALAAAIAWVGLIIVRSRGALGAAVVGIVLFAAAIGFGRRLWRFRVVLWVLCIVGIVAAVAGVTAYGMRHDTLPGGASMLVRWQYWKGAMAMYADKPLAGAGGGNFAVLYPHYKIAAAPETVSDPHNFLLSLLSQYGPAGLMGFLAGFAVVLYRAVASAGRFDASEGVHGQAGPSGRLAMATLAATGSAMLMLRPLLNAVDLGDRIDVKIYVMLVLYIVPVVVFGVVFTLVWFSSRTVAASPQQCGRGLAAGLFCGIAAVAIHNVIDFAIFEPAVLTLFWTIVACLFAADSHARTVAVFVPARPLRLAMIGVTAILAVAFLAFSLMPTVKAGRLTQQALQDGFSTTTLLNQAAKVDALSPMASSTAGKAYLRRYADGPSPNAAILERAADCFREAIARDPANFRHYEKLGQVYETMADRASSDRRRKHLEAAFAALSEAVQRYPGSDRLHLKSAGIAEAVDRNEAAIMHYRRAIEIEDAYRRQFATMYPGRQLFSRLGESNYQLAKARLAELERE